MRGAAKKIDDDEAGAYAYALRLLARREYTKRELLSKLTLKYSAPSAQAALETCVKNRYQSDARCADMLYRHCVFMRQGPKKLYAMLFLKGLDSNLVLSAVEQTDWVDIACNALDKKDLSAADGANGRNKLLAFLLRRGFSLSCSLAALERRLKDVKIDN